MRPDGASRCSIGQTAFQVVPQWLHIAPSKATLMRMSKSHPASSLRSARNAVTPMAFVRAIVRGYERYGADPRDALQQAQITPAQLRKPDARITAAQMETISELAMRQLDDEALGWFSRRLPWGSYGMLARASISSPDLRVALKRWCRVPRPSCWLAGSSSLLAPRLPIERTVQ